MTHSEANITELADAVDQARRQNSGPSLASWLNNPGLAFGEAGSLPSNRASAPRPTLRVRLEVPADPVFAGLAGDTGHKTVPALSAVPVELDLATGDRTDETHGQIIDSSSVLALLARYEGIQWGGAVRAGGDTVTAGLDLPDTVEAGREFTVGVHAARRSGVQGEVAEAVDLSDSTVWCELVVGVADGAGVALPAVPMRVDSGDAWCRCTLVAPPDGLHEVGITLQDVPGWSDIELTEPFMSHDDTLEEN